MLNNLRQYVTYFLSACTTLDLEIFSIWCVILAMRLSFAGTFILHCFRLQHATRGLFSIHLPPLKVLNLGLLVLQIESTRIKMVQVDGIKNIIFESCIEKKLLICRENEVFQKKIEKRISSPQRAPGYQKKTSSTSLQKQP